MKKLPFVLLCLALVFSVYPAAIVAQRQPEDDQLDPAPPVKLPPPGSGVEDASIDVILEPAWTAPVSDLTFALTWGDYDLDGDLDLLVGNDGANRLWQNQGGTFTETWPFTDPENTRSVAWGDYNHDGYLDVAVGNFGGRNRTYLNMGGNTFTEDWEASILQNTTSVAFAGWEIDSAYTAFLAVGVADGLNNVYRYAGGIFTSVWAGALSDPTYSLAWGDYDQDGYPDLAVGNSGQANLIYHNDGAEYDPLTEAFATSELSFTHSVAWGDMNGDGYLDLAIGNKGTPGLFESDQVYCYDDAAPGDFSLCWTSNDRSATTEVAWGDYDGDGDLDLAASSDISGFQTRVYFNVGGMLGAEPGWEFDDETANSQAVAWADWDGDGDLELAIGYYDTANELYGNSNGSIILSEVSDHIYDTRSVAWGDVNSDGYLDLAVGNTGVNRFNQVFTSDGDSLTLAWTSPDADRTRSVAWGDFDGDLDLDLAVGNGQEGASLANRLYRNDGGTLNSWWTFGDSDTYSVAWGDVDGDQDLDLAVGNFGSAQPNQIFISGADGGTLAFTDTMILEPPGDQTLSVAWGDFDQDYDLDLAVGNYLNANRVYVNQGDMTFDRVDIPGSDDTRGVAWGDWDGDGDLELAVANAGADGYVQVLAAEWMTDAWSFEPVFTSADSLDAHSLAWGDYDGDGRLDLAVGTGSTSWGAPNLIYRNTGDTMVKVWRAPAEQADATHSVAWGDFDNDGDLDLAAGNDWIPDKPNRLYVNTWNDEINLANDPHYVVIDKPGTTDNGWFFANYEITGLPTIDVWYTLYDDEGDRAIYIEPQISWDGGGYWEPATGAGGDGTVNLSASPGGTPHLFVWNVLDDLLAHQGYTIPVPPDKTDEEMDVAFRIVVWSNPEHGGLIQRPIFGSDTSIFRVDMRPDWYDSIKLAEPEIVHPGETVQYTILITQADHGMPPAMIVDPLPVEMSVVGMPSWSTGDLDWNSQVVTWTGALEYREQLVVQFDAVVTLPLTNSLPVTNCAYIFDGLHPEFTHCAGVVISSTPTLSESWKLVNGQPANTALPGDPLTYTIILTNTGTENAYDVVMTDSLPSTVTWGDYLTATGGVASYDAAERMVSWEGDVRVFEPVVITYVVTIVTPLPGNSIITNTAWVADGTNEPFVTSPPVTTTIWAPDLRESFKEAITDMVELDDVLTYTILLTNVGGLDANAVYLFDPMPANSTYVPGSFWSSEGSGGYEPYSAAITWTGAVSVGVPVTVTFAITAGCPFDEAHPVITNTAFVDEAWGGPVALEAVTGVLMPDMSPSVKDASPTTFQLYDLVTYTVIIENVGGYAPDAWMSDSLPAKLDGTGACTATLGMVTCDERQVGWEGSLDYGEKVTITFTAEVNGDFPASEIENVARIGDGCTMIEKTTTIYFSGQLLYLPVIMRNHYP